MSRYHPEDMDADEVRDMLRELDCKRMSSLCQNRAATAIGYLVLEAFDAHLAFLNDVPEDMDALWAERSDELHDRITDRKLMEGV